MLGLANFAATEVGTAIQIYLYGRSSFTNLLGYGLMMRVADLSA